MAAPITQLNPKGQDQIETEQSLTLLQRLNLVERDLPVIAKGGTNKDQNYKYIEAAAVVSTLRELFAQYGIYLKSELSSVDFSEFTSKNGTKGEKVVAWFRFTFINCADREDAISFEPWAGVAMDYSDKALNKAMTAAQKTFLMKQFLVSDIDPDADSPEAAASHSQPAPARAYQGQQNRPQPQPQPGQPAQPAKPPQQQAASDKPPKYPKLTVEEFNKILSEMEVSQAQIAEAISDGKFKNLTDWKGALLATNPATQKIQDWSRYALHQYTQWLTKNKPQAGWLWNDKEGLPRLLEDTPFEEMPGPDEEGF